VERPVLVSPVLVRVLVGHTWASQQLLLAEAQGVAILSRQRFGQLQPTWRGLLDHRPAAKTSDWRHQDVWVSTRRQAGVKDVFTPACLRVMTPDAARLAAVLVAGRSTVRPRTRGGGAQTLGRPARARLAAGRGTDGQQGANKVVFSNLCYH